MDSVVTWKGTQAPNPIQSTALWLNRRSLVSAKLIRQPRPQMVICYAAMTGWEEKSRSELSWRDCYPIILYRIIAKILPVEEHVSARIAFACKSLLDQISTGAAWVPRSVPTRCGVVRIVWRAFRGSRLHLRGF